MKENEVLLFSEQEMGGISLEDVFTAYFDCRRRKRNTYNSLEFELDYERKCIDLWREINSGTYRPSRSIAFVVTKPVCREVFAADFRDRVVHHLIACRIEPLFEKQFITDSYSTRKGKGTLYGINRVDGFIRECSEGYARDCYVMKIDIRSFFMTIPKKQLYCRVSDFLKKHYKENDLELLLYLIRVTIFNRPEKYCVRRTSSKLWKNLPYDKSLFNSDGTCGLPIGNLTSQLLALFYLDELDHLIKEEWGVCYYGRYVDDLVLIHESKETLLSVKHKISEWLVEHGLSLHNRKFYLQHYSKGVCFIGAMLKPSRKYINKRTVGYCFSALDKFNRYPMSGVYGSAEKFVSSMNSYLGMMKHFSSYNIRYRVMKQISKVWWKFVYMNGSLLKVILKNRYKNAYLCVLAD